MIQFTEKKKKKPCPCLGSDFAGRFMSNRFGGADEFGTHGLAQAKKIRQPLREPACLAHAGTASLRLLNRLGSFRARVSQQQP